MKWKRRKRYLIINIADKDQEKTKQYVYAWRFLLPDFWLNLKLLSKGLEEGMHRPHTGDTPSCWDFTVFHQL